MSLFFLLSDLLEQLLPSVEQLFSGSLLLFLRQVLQLVPQLLVKLVLLLLHFLGLASEKHVLPALVDETLRLDGLRLLFNASSQRRTDLGENVLLVFCQFFSDHLVVADGHVVDETEVVGDMVQAWNQGLRLFLNVLLGGQVKELVDLNLVVLREGIFFKHDVVKNQMLG